MPKPDRPRASDPPPALPPWPGAAAGFLGPARWRPSRLAGARILEADFDVAGFAPDLFDALEIPRPPRLARAVDKRCAEYLAGRALARAALQACALAQEAPQDASTAGLEETSGAPRAPAWPQGCRGAITHGAGRAAVIVGAPPLDLGIDTERVPQGRTLEALRGTALSHAERAAVDAAQPGALPPAVQATLVFSAKETLYKALYPRVGRFFGFDAAALAGPVRADGLALRLVQDLGPGAPAGAEFGILAAVEAEGGQDAGRVTTWMAAPRG